MDPILRLFPFMCAALVAHLAEEMLTGIRRRFPLREMPRSVFVAVNIIVYSWVPATYLSFLSGHSWGPCLVFIFSLAVLGNGLFHLGYMHGSSSQIFPRRGHRRVSGDPGVRDDAVCGPASAQTKKPPKKPPPHQRGRKKKNMNGFCRPRVIFFPPISPFYGILIIQRFD